MKFFCFPVLFMIVLASCNPVKQQEDQRILSDSLKRDSILIVPVIQPQAIYSNGLLDPYARFMAGLPQLDTTTQYHILEDSKYWLDYQTYMDENWSAMDSTRLLPMSDWKDVFLSSFIDDALPVFYPFSGPDQLHAAVLYPHATEFILSGLEPITELPSLSSLTQQEQDQFLDSLSNSLRDIFGKSFFITRNMRKDLKQIRGVLPLLYTFISRTGHELVSMEYVSVDSLGEEIELPFEKLKSQKVRGVRLEYRNRGGGFLKKLYYFAGDVSNPGLLGKKDWLTFLNRKRPFNTYIKSASYLMHQDLFSGIRDQIIQNSSSVFQDDTGIPYRFLKSDFTGLFYGEYMKPVKDFIWLEKQPDLDSAFKAGSQPLPFSLGYHWGSQKQHYMLFIKKNPIFAP